MKLYVNQLTLEITAVSKFGHSYIYRTYNHDWRVITTSVMGVSPAERMLLYVGDV